MGHFNPKAWYEEQQPDQAAADDADVQGILAARARLMRWIWGESGLLDDEDEDEEDEDA
jgi:hypothetical protein